MKSPQLSLVENSTLRLAPTWQDATISVVIAGTGDLGGRKMLASFLGDLHAEALELSASAVVMDIRELEFMNSSCIKEFLTWLRSIARSEPERRYEVRFISNPRLLWQKRTIESLRATAGVTVRHVQPTRQDH